MPSFDKYEDYSKTLYIRFKCTRCGFEEFEKLSDCSKRTDDRGNYLGQLRLPQGWYDNWYASMALCPKCQKAFDEFRRGGDIDNG